MCAARSSGVHRGIGFPHPRRSVRRAGQGRAACGLARRHGVPPPIVVGACAHLASWERRVNLWWPHERHFVVVGGHKFRGGADVSRLQWRRRVAPRPRFGRPRRPPLPAQRALRGRGLLLFSLPAYVSWCYEKLDSVRARDLSAGGEPSRAPSVVPRWAARCRAACRALLPASARARARRPSSRRPSSRAGFDFLPPFLLPRAVAASLAGSLPPRPPLPQVMNFLVVLLGSKAWAFSSARAAWLGWSVCPLSAGASGLSPCFLRPWRVLVGCPAALACVAAFGPPFGPVWLVLGAWCALPHYS